MEYGDIARGLEPFLDLETAGRGNVLQIDAAEAAGQQGNRLYNVIHVFAADAQRDGVHAAELLKEHTFALHHGHTGFGTDIAQSQHGGAVRDHRHRVPAAGELIAFADILLDLQTGLRDARRICEGQGLFAVHLCAGNDLDLAAQLLMQLQRFCCIIHVFRPFVLYFNLQDKANGCICQIFFLRPKGKAFTATKRNTDRKFSKIARKDSVSLNAQD